MLRCTEAQKCINEGVALVRCTPAVLQPRGQGRHSSDRLNRYKCVETCSPVVPLIADQADKLGRNLHLAIGMALKQLHEIVFKVVPIAIVPMSME